MIDASRRHGHGAAGWSLLNSFRRRDSLLKHSSLPRSQVSTPRVSGIHREWHTSPCDATWGLLLLGVLTGAVTHAAAFNAGGWAVAGLCGVSGDFSQKQTAFSSDSFGGRANRTVTDTHLIIQPDLGPGHPLLVSSSYAYHFVIIVLVKTPYLLHVHPPWRHPCLDDDLYSIVPLPPPALRASERQQPATRFVVRALNEKAACFANTARSKARAVISRRPGRVLFGRNKAAGLGAWSCTGAGAAGWAARRVVPPVPSRSLAYKAGGRTNKGRVASRSWQSSSTDH